MKLKPLGDRLIVKPVEEEETTASGLVLPETAKEKPQKGTVVAAGDGAIAEDGTRRPLEVALSRDTHHHPLVHFKGVPHREAASELVNGELWGDAASLPPAGPGSVYTFQLIGLRVVTSEGRELGVVRDVLQNGPHTLYEVGEKRALIPGHTPFLKHVDLEAGVITLDPPMGIEEL